MTSFSFRVESLVLALSDFGHSAAAFQRYFGREVLGPGIETLALRIG
jgi:hypothetical protein